MRGGGQTEHDDAGVRIAEAGHRPAPVVVLTERGSLRASHLLAPFDEPRAGPALGDLTSDRGQVAAVMIHGDRQ
jgi:hypothetical protein